MRKTFKKLLFTIIVMGAAQLSFAQQNYVHQVIILNEGQYDYVNQLQVIPVSIGAYDPVADSYVEFDIIPEMRWGSDVVVDENNIYMVGDSMLIVYDKDTYNRVDAKVIQGIRKVSIWNNKILVTRKPGNYDAYFQVYDKVTLNLIYELDTLNGPKYSAEGIVIYNDTAYVAVNNSFEWGNYKGLLGIVDLNGQSYTGEVDLGSDGVNPDNLMISGNKLYTLNNKDWNGSSITEFNTLDRSVLTTNLSAPSGCGSSVFALDRVYYHRYDYDTNYVDTNKLILRFNPLDQTIDTTSAMLSGIYGMATDEINNLIYVTTTDYVTFGTAHIMQYDGTIINSFSVGVSPGTMALDVRQISTGVEDVIEPIAVNIYPNPTFSTVSLTVNENIQLYKLSLTDVLGRVVYEQDIRDGRKTQLIDVQEYPKGIYLLTVEAENRKSTYKVVKY